MASISYSEPQPRRRRAADSHSASGRVTLNWRLLLALALNVVVWAGVAKIISLFL